MKHLTRLAALGAVLFIAACASTSFTSTWKAPDAQTLDPAGRKVAAVYVSGDESSRRAAEDVLVQKIAEQGAQGIAAYSLIPSAELRDLERVKARLAQEGVDGVIIMRVISEKDRVSYTPRSPAFEPYYLRFSRYWDYGWGSMYDSTRVTTDTVVSVETLVYSLKRDKLLWAGTSKTVNPAEVSRFVAQLADAVGKEMKKQGLLPTA